MNEPKKPAVKRKLTLNRETLKSLEAQDTRLEGVVGGLVHNPNEITMGTHCFACDSAADCTVGTY